MFCHCHVVGHRTQDKCKGHESYRPRVGLLGGLNLAQEFWAVQMIERHKIGDLSSLLKVEDFEAVKIDIR